MADDLDREWSQWELHTHARKMGINPDPSEIIPQGVKYIAWPQPPLTEREIAWGRELAKKLEAGEIKPIAVIKRQRDRRRN